MKTPCKYWYYSICKEFFASSVVVLGMPLRLLFQKILLVLTYDIFNREARTLN